MEQIWSIKNENCPTREVKRVDELNKFRDGDYIRFSVNDGRVSLESEFIQSMVDNELIPKNCDCTMWYLCGLVERLNIMGYNYDDDIEDNEINMDYFIDLK